MRLVHVIRLLVGALVVYCVTTLVFTLPSGQTQVPLDRRRAIVVKKNEHDSRTTTTPTEVDSTSSGRDQPLITAEEYPKEKNTILITTDGESLGRGHSIAENQVASIQQGSQRSNEQDDSLLVHLQTGEIPNISNVEGTQVFTIGHQQEGIRVPYPVFVASLYKSGTTSIHEYFKCGKQRSVHFEHNGTRIGPCIMNNSAHDRPPFEGCGGTVDGHPFDIFADNNVLDPPGICYDPSIYSLDAVYKFYPNATILLAVRDSYSWMRSAQHFGKLYSKLKACRQLWPKQNEVVGRRKMTLEDIRQFYLWQVNHVREFARAHPSMTFVEVQLESNETGSILEEKTGIPARCWGNKNQNRAYKKKAIAIPAVTTQPVVSVLPQIAVDQTNESLHRTSFATALDSQFRQGGIKVPYPVFVASLYKSGTTSIHEYFKCGKQRSVHFEHNGTRIGPCIMNNSAHDRPPFEGCGGTVDGHPFDIFADNNVLDPPGICYDPSIYSLDAVYKFYPNATILLAVRDSYSWMRSAQHFGKLYSKLKACRQLWPKQNEVVGRRKMTLEDIRQFYLWQVNHVREFARAHPSMTFVEVQLESNETGSILEERIGIPARCWGNRNQNRAYKKMTPRRTNA